MSIKYEIGGLLPYGKRAVCGLMPSGFAVTVAIVPISTNERVDIAVRRRGRDEMAQKIVDALNRYENE